MSNYHSNPPEESRILYRDSLTSITESPIIYDGKLVLSEIPDKTRHVKVEGYREVYEENLISLSSDEFIVNYSNGIVQFHSSVANGTQVKASYYGRGVIVYPASRIYTKTTEGHVTETYQDVVDAIEKIKANIEGSGVSDVNGYTGSVQLTASDVNAVSTTNYSSDQKALDTRINNVETNIDTIEGATYKTDDNIGALRDDVETIKVDFQKLNQNKADSVHSHTEDEIIDLDKYSQSEVDQKIADAKTQSDTDYASKTHTHSETDITDLDKYTQAQVNSLFDTLKADYLPTNYASKTHGHVEADITDLDKYSKTEVDKKVSDLRDVHLPANYAPYSHKHEIAEIVNLQEELDKASASGSGMDIITEKYLHLKKKNVNGVPFIDFFDGNADFTSVLTEVKASAKVSSDVFAGADVVIPVDNVLNFVAGMEICIYKDYELSQTNAVIKSVDGTNKTITIKSLSIDLTIDDRLTTFNANFDSTNYKYTQAVYVDDSATPMSHYPSDTVATFKVDLTQLEITEAMSVKLAGMGTGFYAVDVGIFADKTNLNGYALNVHNDVDGDANPESYETTVAGKELYLRVRFGNGDFTGIYGMINHIDALKLFTDVSSGKTKIATAITDKGVTGVSGDSTFQQLADAIGTISTSTSSTPITKPNKISKIYIFKNSVGDFTFQWDLPEGFPTIEVSGYNVYLNGIKLNSSLIQEGKYIVDRSVIEDASQLTFPDFRVRAVSSFGLMSDPSDKITSYPEYDLYSGAKITKFETLYDINLNPYFVWYYSDKEIYYDPNTIGFLVRLYDDATGEHIWTEYVAQTEAIKYELSIPSFRIEEYKNRRLKATITGFAQNWYYELPISDYSYFQLFDLKTPVTDVKAVFSGSNDTDLTVSWSSGEATPTESGYVVLLEYKDGEGNNFYKINNEPENSSFPRMDNLDTYMTTNTSIKITGVRMETFYDVTVIAIHTSPYGISSPATITTTNETPQTIDGEHIFIAGSTEHGNPNIFEFYGDEWMMDSDGKIVNPIIGDNKETKTNLKISTEEELILFLHYEIESSYEDDFWFYIDHKNVLNSEDSSRFVLYYHNFIIPAGRHDLLFKYEKDGSYAHGSDRVRLSHLSMIPRSSSRLPQAITNLQGISDSDSAFISFDGGNISEGKNVFRIQAIDKETGYIRVDEEIKASKSQVEYTVEGLVPNRNYDIVVTRVFDVFNIKIDSSKTIIPVKTEASTSEFVYIGMVSGNQAKSTPLRKIIEEFGYYADVIDQENVTDTSLDGFDVVYAIGLDQSESNYLKTINVLKEASNKGIPMLIGSTNIVSEKTIAQHMGITTEEFDTHTFFQGVASSTGIYDIVERQIGLLTLYKDNAYQYFGHRTGFIGTPVLVDGEELHLGLVKQGTLNPDGVEIKSNVIFAPIFQEDSRNIATDLFKTFMRRSIQWLFYEHVAPSAPSNLTWSQNPDGSIRLSWDANTESDISGYNIYLDGVRYAKNHTSNSYDIKGLVTGTTYEVFVCALDKANNESKDSVLIEVVTNADSLKPNPPKVYKEEMYTKAYITWDKPPEFDIAGYNIYVDQIKQNQTLIPKDTREYVLLFDDYNYDSLDVQVSSVDINKNESIDNPITTISRDHSALLTNNEGMILSAGSLIRIFNTSGSQRWITLSFFTTTDGSPLNYSTDFYWYDSTGSQTGTDSWTYSTETISIAGGGYVELRSDVTIDVIVKVDDLEVDGTMETRTKSIKAVDLGFTDIRAKNVYNETIVIEWNMPLYPSLIKEYEIYVDNVLATKASGINASATIPNLNNYQTYRISAKLVTIWGEKTEITPEIEAQPVDTIKPREPIGVELFPTNGKILVSWLPNQEDDLLGYNVYVGSVKHNQSIITDTKYTIEGLTNGFSYFVYVTAVDSTEQNESIVTNTFDVYLDNFAPKTPIGINVVPIDTGIYNSWLAVNDVDIQGYNVYLDGVKHNSTPITQTEYKILGLTNGSKYAIQISTLDSGGLESLLSSSVYVTPSIPILPVDTSTYNFSPSEEGIFSFTESRSEQYLYYVKMVTADSTPSTILKVVGYDKPLTFNIDANSDLIAIDSEGTNFQTMTFIQQNQSTLADETVNQDVTIPINSNISSFSVEHSIDPKYYGVKITDETRIFGANGLVASDFDSIYPWSDMRRCVVKADGKVNYYLDANDSSLKADGTPALLDGTDGNVMVEIPSFFYGITQDTIYVYDRPAYGMKYFEGGFIGAFEAHDSNKRLHSISNVKPSTMKSISEMNIKTFRINEDWHVNDVETLSALRALFSVEYGSMDSAQVMSNGVSSPEGSNLLFEGSGYVEFGDILNAVIGNPSTQFTVEAKIKPSKLANTSTAGVQNPFFCKQNVQIGVSPTGGLQVYINSDSELQTFGDGIIKAGSEHNIGVTFNSGTLRVVVDDVEYNGTVNPTTINANTHPLTVGGSTFNGKYFNGIVREVRVWDHARTTADIISGKDAILKGLETGLVGYWRINDGINRVKDKTSGRNHGLPYYCGWDGVINTGQTISLGNRSGVGLNKAISYRGIENIWGNTFELVSGVLMIDDTYYFADKAYDSYQDSKITGSYKKVKTRTSLDQGGYINKLLDSEYFIGDTFGDGSGYQSNYIGNSQSYLVVGGDFVDRTKTGMFRQNFNFTFQSMYSLKGFFTQTYEYGNLYEFGLVNDNAVKIKGIKMA